MYIIFATKTRIKRYVITKEGGYKPCSCIYEEHSRYNTLFEAIEAKQELEKDVK